MSYQTKALLEAPFQIDSACAKGAIRESGNITEIFLQRQGVSTTLNIICKYFSAELQEWQNTGNFTVNYRAHGINKQIINHNGRLPIESCIAYLAKYASQRLDRDVYINPQVMDYMYSGYTMYDYQKTDLVLSTTYYCELTDSIRRCDNAALLAQFKAGDYQNPLTGPFGSGEIITKIAQGFMCDGDKKRGITHIKRRIAWLAGCEIQDKDLGFACEFVSKEMERVDMFALDKALAANSLAEKVTLLRGHWNK